MIVNTYTKKIKRFIVTTAVFLCPLNFQPDLHYPSDNVTNTCVNTAYVNSCC